MKKRACACISQKKAVPLQRQMEIECIKSFFIMTNHIKIVLIVLISIMVYLPYTVLLPSRLCNGRGIGCNCTISDSVARVADRLLLY